MAEGRERRRWGRLAFAAGLLLLALGGWQMGSAAYLHAKAWLAQVLLAEAWAATLAGGGPQKPWPWADTAPVARLQVPSLGIDQIVLAGVSGRSLAFGPGHLDGTARPGTRGHSVLSGHRDTHFRFLQDLTPGTRLRIQRTDGRWRSYRVGGSAVIDAGEARLALGTGRPVVTLVTCYPFDAITPGGPLRYLVSAEAERRRGPPRPYRPVGPARTHHI
jgi:sortase A